MMNERWTDHVEYLTKRLYPNLEGFSRDDPFPRSPDIWFYFLEYIKSYDCRKVHKSVEVAWDYLKQGNEQENCRERISSYTQSIFFAPDNSPTLMIAYLKRSELLSELGYIIEARNDSSMAFQCFINNVTKSPNEIMFMNSEPEVDVLGKLVRETSMKMNIPQEEFSYVQHGILSLLRRQLTIDFNMLIENDEWPLPALKDGENVDFPSSSKVLKVEYNETKGRHVVANVDIKMGDVLFVEKPFSLAVHKQYCSHCCQRRYTYFPCIYCRDVQYCCKRCRDEAWISYHTYECGFVELLKQTGIGYLALKTFLQAESDIDKLKDLSLALNATDASCSTEFSAFKYENVYNLLTHSENMETVDYLQYSLTASLLSFYLIHYAQYAAKTEENVRFCSAVLLRHITQLVTNAHSITVIETKTDENCEVSFDEEEEAIGSGIYPSVSIMNHSCEPSVYSTFHKSYIVVKAAKDLKSGEEVFNSYGVDCRRMKRRDRKDVLSGQYLFDCKCISCSEKYDPYDALNSFKCGKCKGPLVKEVGVKKSGKPVNRVCLRCSEHQITTDEMMTAKFYTEELLKLGEYHLTENNNSEALQVFLKAWKLSREFFYAFHKHTSIAAKKIALCLFRLNHLKSCIKVLSCSMMCVEGRYGLYSSELGIEAKKLCDVISYYWRDVQKTRSDPSPDVLTDEEKEAYQKGKNILKTIFGDDHPIVLEVLRNDPLL